MIIKKLKIQNIRSYKDVAIEFSLGKTLFEGDIGSGKSTILMAIEFALFGLGSEKGGALLRIGESEGKVSLIFEIDGKEYTIIRSLTKAKNRIQQDEGTIKTPEGIIHLSPTELKEKVLEILSFNEPLDPKAQSVIYRYAIFTPQEEMKAILFMSSDIRLQTLRKAFRLEDYKIAIENAKMLSNTIEHKIDTFEGATFDLSELEKKISNIILEIEEKIKEVNLLRRKEEQAVLSLENFKTEMSELHVQEVNISQSTREVALLIESMTKGTQKITEIKDEIKQVNKKISDISPKIFELEKIENPIEKSEEELKNDIRALEKQEKAFRKIETQFEEKLKDYESVRDNGICPTCDREADPDEFIGKIRDKELEKEEAQRKVTEVEKLLEETNKTLDLKRHYNNSNKDLTMYQKNLFEYSEQREKLFGNLNKVEVEVGEYTKRMEIAKKDLGRLEETKRKIEDLDISIKKIDRELTSIRKDLSGVNKYVETRRQDKEDFEQQLKRKKELQKRAEVLKEFQIWIDSYFIPTLDAIEKQIMLSINQDFNASFQKWFSMLVEDPGKEAHIDEAFTPIIEQDGYEQEINYLSGGEKTSIALAYRLALNNIVQKVSTGMSSNLLILDEPTDGFSKEQLGKVRDILDEVQSPQVIIVSHEKELESFADQIFKITKISSESKIV